MGKAYTEALAFESITDAMKERWDDDNEVYREITTEEIEAYAKIVAYKVFHNLKNGHFMDKDNDPIVVETELGRTPASEYWKEHYE